ncbi:hypothetical protein BS17DRAFT_734832 [Gyrodon lividus]|nr:hypothetical protein BS17DRAFT_734832 [Gyrodon lividus]
MGSTMKLTLTSWLGRLEYFLRLLSSRGTFWLRYTSTFFRRLLSLLSLPLRGRREDHRKHPSTVINSGGRPSLAPESKVGSSRCYILASAAVSPNPTSSPETTPLAFRARQYPLTAAAGPSSLHVSPSRPSTPVTSTNYRTKKLLQPFAPEEIKRYERPLAACINRKKRVKVIPPFKLDYSISRSDHEWKRCTHPEGALYFNLEQDGRRTMTDINMDDQHTRDLVNGFVITLWSKIDHDKYPEVELVVDISYDEKSDTCIGKYYFVSRRNLTIFWFHEYIPDLIFYRVKGVEASDHIRLAIETQYWFHCELFPNHISISKAIVEDLNSILVHAISDAILSDDSLVPFSAAELQQFLDLMTNVGDAEHFGQKGGYITSVIGRLMRIFTRLKFVNFHGQVGARLNADQSLYGRNGNQKERSMSYFVRLFDPILFNTPSFYVKQLHGIWVDHTINLLRWRSFIGTLCDEWNGFTIYSTVLLAVDVSFLAIPEMNGSTTIQTVAEFAIFLSTASAVGSLVASVLLTNQSRGQGMKSADQVAADMLHVASTSIGLDALGIMYSLPFGLIMWGMVFFIIALSLIVFGQGSSTPRIVAVPFCIIIAILASWPAWYKGERMLLSPRLLKRAKKKP